MTLNNKLKEVQDEYLRRMTSGNGQLLRQVEGYVSARSGKMLRPRLTLMAAKTLGDDTFDSRRTLLLAVAVEMLHNASLLHDDVIDHADNRRGAPSVNAQWGNAAAVLVGDYLLAQIMQLLNELNDSDAARRINDTVAAMVESELLALDLGGCPKSEEQYISIIDGKTARLFSTAAALGNPAYEEYGLHYGRYFQLCDDMHDGESTPWTKKLIKQELDTLRLLESKELSLDLPTDLQ